MQLEAAQCAIAQAGPACLLCLARVCIEIMNAVELSVSAYIDSTRAAGARRTEKYEMQAWRGAHLPVAM